MIGFIGLSHLGINYSLATAAHGFEVVAFHPSPDLVSDLSVGRFPVEEPGLPELFAEHRARIRYTAEPGPLNACLLVFITLDVKTDSCDQSDTAPLLDLILSTVPHLRAGTVLVLLSQVPPGFTRELRSKLIAQGTVSEIYYQVETLVFGRAVERAMQPERYIVGTADPQATLPVELRAWHTSFGCPVLRMRYESAELAKIAINFFLVSSVCTANTLAEFCAQIGGDWSEIVPALRLDARIGPKAYLSPGLGIAGGNLERDLTTLQMLSAEGKNDTGIINAWRHNSEHGKGWTVRTLRLALAQRNMTAENAKIALWGLAYKENTHSTKNSPAVEFLKNIPECEVCAYDPVARLGTGPFPRVEQTETMWECCNKAMVLVIATPWPVFRQASLEQLHARTGVRIVLDPFGVLDSMCARSLGFDYYRLGVPPCLAVSSTN